MPQKKRIDDIHKGRTNLFSIPWDKTEPAVELLAGRKRKVNVRRDFGDIKEFAQSLKAGVKVPVRGYMGTNGKFQITDGERRWLGAHYLQTHEGIKLLFPCIREPQSYTGRDRKLDLLLTNSGKPLEMIEKAHAIKRLIEEDGMKEKEIAKAMGASQTHVTDCLALLQTAPELQAAVKAGRIKATTAIDLARAIPDKKRQAQELEQAQKKADEAASKKLSSRAHPATAGGVEGPVPAQPQLPATKVTAKHLSVATGKKAQAEKKNVGGASAPRPASSPAKQDEPRRSLGGGGPARSTSNAQTNAAAPLEELLDAVQRSDCRERERYDTLEFVVEFLHGRKPLATATKFILGII